MEESKFADDISKQMAWKKRRERLKTRDYNCDIMIIIYFLQLVPGFKVAKNERGNKMARQMTI